MTVTGKRTGLTRDVSVYFPPQYYGSAYQGFKFPVIEWIPNYPSGPEVVTGPYGLPAQLDAAIARNALPPSLVIIPDPTGKPKIGHDTQCVDEVDGSANDTYLTADIRDWAIEKLGANPQRKAWTMAGWSSGGYCAMNLVTRHPQWYGQAASVSGYAEASVDAETENLFKGRQDIIDANKVTLNLQKHPSPVDILAIAGDKEGFESSSLDQLQAAVRTPATLSSWRIPDAGLQHEHLQDADPRRAGVDRRADPAAVRAAGQEDRHQRRGQAVAAAEHRSQGRAGRRRRVATRAWRDMPWGTSEAGRARGSRPPS